MELVIVTGLSGAGKSAAVDALEDIGYFCVDNMPPELIPTFVNLILKSKEKRERVAVVADIRLGTSFSALFDVLGDLENMNVKYKILFIDADNEVIMRRYQETRRKHPLSDMFDSPSILEAIQTERETLLPARQKADYIIDTTQVKSSQFKERVAQLFLDDVSNLVFDVRCLPNPFYIPELKQHTGLEEPVRNFVMKFEQARGLEVKLFDLLDYLIPLYRSEGKNQLTIAVGCTGGKHRSVVFAELINKHLLESGACSSVFHRDMKR